MYLVRSIGDATAPDIPGNNVQWTPGQTRYVHESLIQSYRNNPAAWEIVATPDYTPVTSFSTPATGRTELSGGIRAAAALKSGQSLGNVRVNFDTLTGASVSGGSGIAMELVSVVVPETGKIGNSIKVTVNAGLTRTFTAPAFTAGPIPTSTLALVMESLTPETFSMDMVLANEVGFTNRYTSSLSITQYGLQCHAPATAATRDEFADTGSPAFLSLTNARFVIAAPAGQAAVVIFHGLYSSPGGIPTFELICDDGHISGYTELLPLLNMYNIKAGFAVIRSLIGTANYLTEKQLQEIHDSGHDILVHGLTNLSSFGSLALAYADIDSNTAYVRDRGWRGGDLYVYPNGASNYSATDGTSIANYLASKGFKAAYHTSGKPDFRKGGIGKYRTGRFSWAAWMATTDVMNRVNACTGTGRSFVMNIHIVVASGMIGDQINRADLNTILLEVDTLIKAGSLNNYSPTVACDLLV